MIPNRLQHSPALFVLDKGYVRLVDIMGSDLSPVNDARASFMKESDELTERDEKLLRFLAEAQPPHTHPFRGAVLKFEVKAPMMVARQWFKYRIGSSHSADTAELLGYPDVPWEVLEWAWGGNGDDAGFGETFHARNEASRRYVTIEPEFYFPAVWRAAPESRKQGSGSPVSDAVGTATTRRLQEQARTGLQAYQDALTLGVCPEQARLFLPTYGLYTVWRWTCSLQAVCHFLRERLGEGAQAEITEYAKVVRELTEPHFPVSVGALLKRCVDERRRDF